MTIRTRYDIDADRYAREDFWKGHTDHKIRGRIRADIDREIDDRQMFRADAHLGAGIPPGSLDDGSLPTERLREVLAAIRAMPRINGVSCWLAA